MSREQLYIQPAQTDHAGTCWIYAVPVEQQPDRATDPERAAWRQVGRVDSRGRLLALDAPFCHWLTPQDEPLRAGAVFAPPLDVDESQPGLSLTLNAPAFFRDAAFVEWLNSRGQPRMTWHADGEPGEWSDLVVLVDPSLNGEGCSSDMPVHCWTAILGECRRHFRSGLANTHIPVRITNLAV